MTIVLVITMALCALIALTALAVMTHRARRLISERNALGNELDMWKTSGMHYYHAYPRFDWPKGVGEAADIREQLAAMHETADDYERFHEEQKALEYAQENHYDEIESTVHYFGEVDPTATPKPVSEQIAELGDSGRYGGENYHKRMLLESQAMDILADADDQSPCLACHRDWADCHCVQDVIGRPEPQALIVDEVYQHRYADGTPTAVNLYELSEGRQCCNCETLLRDKEQGGSLCTSCAELAQRWYTKPLDQGFGELPHPSMNPHLVWMRHPRYDERDGICGSALYSMTLFEYEDWDTQADPSFSDVHVAYRPPEQGPREGSRSPSFRSDFLPPQATPDYDDIPF